VMLGGVGRVLVGVVLRGVRVMLPGSFGRVVMIRRVLGGVVMLAGIVIRMLVVGPGLAETEEHADKHQNRTETKTMAHRALGYRDDESGSIDNSMTGVIGVRLARS
jgi:hypothetical protein